MDVGDALQQATRELPPDDRGELQCPLRRLLQAVDARHDHILDSVGDEDLVDRLGQDIAVSSPSQGPDFQEGLDHLLDEEGIAFGLADDQGLERLGRVSVASSACAISTLCAVERVLRAIRV